MADTACTLTRKPGQVIRPALTLDVARGMVERLYRLKVAEISELESYDDRNYFVQVADEHNNPNIQTLWPHGYVFKVLNAVASQNDHVFAEHACASWLTERGFLISRPVLNIFSSETSRETLTETQNSTAQPVQTESGGSLYIVRLLAYIPGTLLKHVPCTSQLIYRCGRYLGRMTNALQGFHHVGFQRYDLVWHLDNLPALTEYTSAIKHTTHHQLISDVLQAFQTHVLHNKHQFRIGTIYNDFNDANVLVERCGGDGGGNVEGQQEGQQGEQQEHDVSGIIDLGDMNESCIVFDIAIAIMYLMLRADKESLLDVGRYALAGYQSQFPLTQPELKVLKVCIAARFAQSLVMATYSACSDPDNNYTRDSLTAGWHCLHTLWHTADTHLHQRWGISLL